MKLSSGLCVVVIAAFAGHASGQVSGELSVSQAVSTALRNHPMVKASQLGMDQAMHRIAEARADRAPKVSISETVTHGNNPVFVFGSLLEQAEFGPGNFELSSLNNPSSLTNFRSSVFANFLVFDGRKTSSRIHRAEIGKDVAQLQSQAAEQRVRFDVLQHYFGLALAETALEVAESALRTAESDVERARDRVDAGLAVQSDLLAAQVQLAEFKQQRIQAEGERSTALASLNVAMGNAVDTPRTLAVGLTRKVLPIPGSEELFTRALYHRPDYRQSVATIEAADRRISEERSAYLPQVNLFASAGTSGRDPLSGSGDYTIGASATLNVFDRARPARVGQAEVDRRFAETERDRIADQIRVDVVGAYHRYRAAEQQVDVVHAAFSQAAEGLRIVQNRYEAGLTTITELLRAETAVVRARMNMAVAVHGQYIGYAAVLLSIGELNDVGVFER